jgi:hypothetical protein
MTISNPSLTQISQALAEMLPKLKPLSVPTGMISAFHTVPEGWLQCNGAAVSRTTYAALFAVVGTKYGSGDGSTTFNLPNLHHKFIEGTNTTSEVGQSVSAGLPNITGTVTASWVRGTGAFKDAGNGNCSDGELNGPTKIDFSASRSSNLYGSSSTVQPAAVRSLLCIKI